MGLYIGLISGTSVDAIDAVLVSGGVDSGAPRLLAARAHEIPGELRTRIVRLAEDDRWNPDELFGVDVELGRVLADAAIALLGDAGLERSAVLAIGSHGQTVRHRPVSQPPFTAQIGDPNVIAQCTGITTVADFRRRDVAAGGQGAPLVPAFHAAALRPLTVPRAVVNIGGISNVTYLSPRAADPVLGFDTGPGNLLMDCWIAKILGPRFDRDGGWAGTGRPDEGLLTTLRREHYFDRAPPKSTGREEFNERWLLARLEHHIGIAAADVQRTLCEFTAVTIADGIRRWMPACREVLVCGGGACNTFLMARLAQALAPHDVVSTAAFGIDPEWMEAIAFAWLAMRTLAYLPGNLPSVTGAREAVVLGGVYPGGSNPE